MLFGASGDLALRKLFRRCFAIAGKTASPRAPGFWASGVRRWRALTFLHLYKNLQQYLEDEWQGKTSGTHFAPHLDYLSTVDNAVEVLHAFGEKSDRRAASCVVYLSTPLLPMVKFARN